MKRFITRAGAALSAALLMTLGLGVGAASATTVENQRETFKVVVWQMPSWTGPQTPTWPQTYVSSSETHSTQGALDVDVPKCGYFQVDVYKYTSESDITKVDALIKGGVLNGPGNPPEPLIPGGWGTAYKLFNNACTATPVEPTVNPPTCESPTTVTLPETVGVIYAQKIKDGVIVVTAVPAYGYEFKGESQKIVTKIEIQDALACVTPVPPKVVVSDKCDVQGSYTIPVTEHVSYLLDGKPIAAGTYNGPATGVITATADEGYVLTDKGWSFKLSVPKAEVCVTPTPTPTPTPTVTPTPTPTPTVTPTTPTPTPTTTTVVPTPTPTVSCDVELTKGECVLPQTGSSTPWLGGIAALLLALGAGLYYLTRNQGEHA